MPLPGIDVRRTAALLFDAELVERRIDAASVLGAPGLAALRRSSPGILRRAGQRARMKLGRVDGVEAVIGVARELRRSVLGDAADGPPRFLLRVDEFPCARAYSGPQRYGNAAALALHEILTERGVPYMMAVVPQLTKDHLDPHATTARELGADEYAVLRRLETDGVAFGEHGTSHRTRYRSSRRHSEISGLDDAALKALLDAGRARLADAGVRPTVFVPPFNRFDPHQWRVLAERYDVITGGPETVRLVGLEPGPTWRGDAVYLPCYAPLYERSREVVTVVDRIVAAGPGTWVPIVLHLSWEIDDDFRSLTVLADKLASFAASWSELSDAVERSHRLASTYEAAPTFSGGASGHAARDGRERAPDVPAIPEGG